MKKCRPQVIAKAREPVDVRIGSALGCLQGSKNQSSFCCVVLLVPRGGTIFASRLELFVHRQCAQPQAPEAWFCFSPYCGDMRTKSLTLSFGWGSARQSCRSIKGYQVPDLSLGGFCWGDKAQHLRMLELEGATEFNPSHSLSIQMKIGRPREKKKLAQRHPAPNGRAGNWIWNSWMTSFLFSLWDKLGIRGKQYSNNIKTLKLAGTN